MCRLASGARDPASTPFDPHLGRVAVLRDGLAPTHASGTVFRSSLSSAFAPGTAIGPISLPSSASEHHPQVWLMVESIFDSCAFGLKNMGARQNIQIRERWEEEL